MSTPFVLLPPSNEVNLDNFDALFDAPWYQSNKGICIPQSCAPMQLKQVVGNVTEIPSNQHIFDGEFRVGVLQGD